MELGVMTMNGYSILLQSSWSEASLLDTILIHTQDTFNQSQSP